MLKASLLAALLLSGTGSFDDGPVGFKDAGYRLTVANASFSTLPLNSPQTTDAVKVKGFRYFVFNLQYVFSTASAVTMTCQTSDDQTTPPTNWYDVHILNSSTPPTVTSAPMVWSYAAGASKNWTWTVPVRNVWLRCSFAGTGAGAGDTLTATGRAGFY